MTDPIIDDDPYGPTKQYYESVCKHIHEAWERFVKDRQMLYDKYANDFMRQGHEIDVRKAQFILETADLERTRMMLTRTLATLNNKSPIAGIVIGGA